MKTISNVLVLIADGVEDSQGDKLLADDVKIAERVRVSLEFSLDHPIGTAEIRRDGNNFIADLTILDDFSSVGLYPCVGGARDIGGRGMDIFEVALCSGRNADERIPHL
jgi:hypothetical protein